MWEAALDLRVGGPAIMRAQMKHLIAMAELDNVTLQVVRSDVGAHPGVQGPFAILKFPDADDADTVYVETVAGELFVEDADEVDRFGNAFRKQAVVAESPEATIALIAERT